MANLPLTAASLAPAPHGFWGRHPADDGTESGGMRYREAVRAALAPTGGLAMLRQTHSADCRVVERPWKWSERPDGDALATDRPGMALGLVTADCAPVLLLDAEAGVIGAAHAGWRGALGGVLGNTVAAMERLGAARGRIVAAIGPAIQQDSYEVDERLHARFPAATRRFFRASRPGHWLFDLPGYVAARLRETGVERIADLGADTYAQPGLFHSFRRASHEGRPEPGRQISAIVLP